MAYGPPIQLTVDRGLATIFSPRSRWHTVPRPCPPSSTFIWLPLH
jgi:hypothetical protein